MSSAYSIVRNYNQFRPPVNLELMAQAMQVKQQKYDQGYQMVQSVIDFTKNIDLVKSEDRQYLDERITKLTNDLNSLNGADLGNKGVQSAYKKYLNQALDENVINGIISTKTYRNFQAEVQNIKEKTPDKYSTVNEMYALRPFMEYMNDGKVGSKLSNMNYTPYKDVSKEKANLLKDMMTNRSKEKFQFKLGNGEIVEKTFEGLKPYEVEQVIEGMLSPQDRQQIAINGWYKMGMPDKKGAENILTSYKDRQISNIEGEIAIRKKSLEGKTPKEQKSINDEIVNLENLKTRTEQEIESSMGSVEKIGSFFEKTDLINGLAQMYLYKQIGEEYKVDEHYKMLVDHNFKAQELELNKNKYLLDVNKFEWEKTKEQLTASNNYEGILDRTVGNNLNDIDLKWQLDNIDKEDFLINSQLDLYLDEITKDSKEKENIKNAAKEESIRTGKPFEQVYLNKIRQTDKVDINAIADLQKRLDTQKALKDGLSNIYEDTYKTIRKSMYSSNDKEDSMIKKALIDNHSIMHTDGKKESIRDYLVRRGYEGDIKDYKKVEEFIKQDKGAEHVIVRQALADNFLNERNAILQTTSGLGYKKIDAKNNPKEDYYINLLAKEFGENVSEYGYSYTKIKDKNSLTGERTIATLTIKGAPKTENFLKQSQKIKDTIGLIGVASNFGESVTTKKVLGYETFVKQKNDKINEYFGKVGLNKSISVSNVNKELHNELQLLYGQKTDGVIHLEKTTDGYKIYTEKSKDGQSVKEAEKLIPKNDIANNRIISKYYDLKSESGLVRKDFYVPIKSLPLTYYTDKDSYNISAAERPLYKKEGSYNIINYLKSDNLDEKTKEKYTPYYNALKTIIDNADKISISTDKLSRVGGEETILVNYNFKGAKLYTVPPMTKQEYYNFRESIYNQNPVIFNSAILSNIVESIMQNPDNEEIAYIKDFK